MNWINLNLSKADEHVEDDVAGDDVRIVEPSSHVLKVFGQFVAGIHLPKFPQVCQELLLQVHSEIAISINDQIKTISFLES